MSVFIADVDKLEADLTIDRVDYIFPREVVKVRIDFEVTYPRLEGLGELAPHTNGKSFSVEIKGSQDEIKKLKDKVKKTRQR